MCLRGMTVEFFFSVDFPFNIFMSHPRSPEAKKRKAPADKAATNGPSAKKAKPSAESSSSEESSSEDDEAVAKSTKAAPAGNISILNRQKPG